MLLMRQQVEGQSRSIDEAGVMNEYDGDTRSDHW